jgi:shikimate dehydrogenase
MADWFKITPGVPYLCVVGSPIEPSKSPLIHRPFARQAGLGLRYEKVEVSRGDLADALAQFHRLGGRGMNVTVPLKEEAHEVATVIRPRAARAGAANTLWFDADGDLCADNTDGTGLIRDLRLNHGFDFSGKRILLVGAGGAARGALPALLEAGPRSVTVVNRTFDKARDLASRCADLGAVSACGYAELEGPCFDLVVNATSLSLAGRLPPLPAGTVGDRTWCYDMMYGAAPTCFMRWGREQGARNVLDGLGMLVEQAAESFLVWHGVRPETAPVVDALRSG